MLPLSDPDVRKRRFPVIMLLFIGMCTAVFLYELALDDASRMAFFYKYGLIPAEITQGIDFTHMWTPFGWLHIDTGFPNWLTIFTSMFIHGSWMHFLSNMLYLWVFGKSIEDRFGHAGFLALYLTSGVLAAGMQISIDILSEVPMIGASGAIAGILGAYFLLFPLSRIRTVVVLLVFITFIRIPAVFLLGFWLLLQFFGGIGSLGLTEVTGGTAYWAHIGGFVAGLAGAVIYKVLSSTIHRRQTPRYRH